MLEGFPIRVDVPLAWGDMDAMGHVNNTVYFRMFETARIAYLRAIDLTSGSGVGPILASTHCRFRRPLHFPDTVTVAARTSEIGADRFTMEYRIVNGAGELAAEGGGVVVAYDYGAGRKVPIPEAVRHRMDELATR
ncbi:MAG: thioesterase family protein [Gemmatimonadota bacterium]